jgi:polynucleotide 5'-kinase involved in rRNA processing
MITLRIPGAWASDRSETASEPETGSEILSQPESTPALHLETEIEAKPPSVIAVFGQTGTGKTSFIKAATGDQALEIGHGLESCERLVMHFEETEED